MLISFAFSLALILQANLLFLVTCLHNNQVHDLDLKISNAREAIEIIIGGGGGIYTPSDPPPSTSPCPPPPAPYLFESKRIEIVYPVIQKFKQKIKYDPHGITNTWVGPDICNKYEGFFCDILLDYNQTALAGVTFNGFDFDGPELTLDGFIDELPDITVFHANSNNFKGVIPANIAKVKYLYELDLSNNKYTGEFPYQVFSTRLTFLDLRFNIFSGMVPSQAFLLDVDVLFINNNNFFRTLPENLGSTPARYVTLANNNFTGPIPKSIGRAAKTLTELVLLNNQLSGCLPCEIGLLVNTTLFDASGNSLSGPIPKSFACLGHMQYLNLAHNKLYGPISGVLCKLPNLRNMSLSYNYFTEIGPECWKLILKKMLDVRMNCIPGFPGQRSPAECHAFFSKPKLCDVEKRSLNWIPCSHNIRRNSLELVDDVPMSKTEVELPRSYAALNPRRL